ncbi:MAG: class I SAM-dependent methyltransferase [Anaerolineae bacterium]
MPKHDWTEKQTLLTWDAGQFANNPLRPELLDMLVNVLKDLYQPGKWTLDIGFGTGLVEELLFQHVPAFQVVGIDSSAEMMALADKRLAVYGARYQRIAHDFAQLDALSLPPQPYQFVISVQALHHLTPDEMQAAYRWIYRTLEPGGIFLLADRIRVAASGLWDVYQSLWRRLDVLHSGALAAHEGLTFVEHEGIVAERGDLPVTIEEHLQWMRAAGFETALLFVHTNRALFAARKPG